MDQWLDEDFLLHYPKSCSIERADQVVHHFVNTLLLMGEEGSNHKKLQNTTKISNHELQISSVMCYMKPGLMNIFFKRFERDVLRDYLHQVSQAPPPEPV